MGPVNKKRFVVVGIDGMPYSLLLRLMENGLLGQCKEIADKLQKKSICSVMPPVSSTAWVSYATGCYPEEHGIFGFTEMGLTGLYIPTVKERQKEAVWNKLSREGRKVGIINVPFTYPPEAVNGVMISCFLSPTLKAAVRPENYYKILQENEYIIDVNPPENEEDKERFLGDLIKAMKARVKVLKQISHEISWDYLHLHIMETDRLFHFFWDEVNSPGTGLYGSKINEFFRVLDDSIAEIYRELGKDSGFTLISDHGFCKILYEVQVNAWLFKAGFYQENDIYSLTPGRIYINKKGTEKKKLAEELEYALSNLCDVQGNRVIRNVYRKEALYSRANDSHIPDLLLNPVNGYDLKGGSPEGKVFTNSMRTGMHTYENAVMVSTAEIGGVTDITQAAGALLREGDYGWR